MCINKILHKLPYEHDAFVLLSRKTPFITEQLNIIHVYLSQLFSAIKEKCILSLFRQWDVDSFNLKYKSVSLSLSIGKIFQVKETGGIWKVMICLKYTV